MKVSVLSILHDNHFAHLREKRLLPYPVLSLLLLPFMSLSRTILRSTDCPFAVSVLTTSRTTCFSKPIAATSSTTLLIGTPLVLMFEDESLSLLLVACCLGDEDGGGGGGGDAYGAGGI